MDTSPEKQLTKGTDKAPDCRGINPPLAVKVLSLILQLLLRVEDGKSTLKIIFTSLELIRINELKGGEKMGKTFDDAVELACRQPNLVARRALKAGLCDADLYLQAQGIYGAIARRDPFAAEVFAKELQVRGDLKLAFAERV